MLRVEDIDTPRVVPGALESILDDLRWLGLDWDEGPDVGGPCDPYVQSARTARYDQAIARLEADGQVYSCDCSRAEIARVASAPHGEEGPIYPGLCRTASATRSFRRPPAIRLRTGHHILAFEDLVHGPIQEDLASQAGDFVLRRGDGIFSYQLAVVVDDLAMGITDVVRGADLLSSTARQIALAERLGGVPPRFAHAPLVIGPEGSRLAKRAPGVALRDHRENGTDPRIVVALLARILGLGEPHAQRIEPRDLIDRFAWNRIRRSPVAVDARELVVVGES